jgi:hypothetical protein
MTISAPLDQRATMPVEGNACEMQETIEEVAAGASGLFSSAAPRQDATGTHRIVGVSAPLSAPPQVPAYAEGARAAIIAVVDLVRTFSTHEDTAFDLSRRAGTPARGTSFTIPEHEAAFGNYSPGRFGFLFDNRRALPEPVPARGMLSLWEVPPDVQTAIDAQLVAEVAR